MAVPIGAISNTSISLVGAIKNPTASNVVGAITDAVSIANNPGANKLAQGAEPLLTSVANTIGGGAPFNPINGINQAVRLATGSMDPRTAAIAGSVSSGINALFGANGVFNPMSPTGPPGNKPIALRTETMAAQNMASAYSEGQDVVFSFVRAGSTLQKEVDDGIDFESPDVRTSRVLGSLSKKYGGVDGSVASSLAKNNRAWTIPSGATPINTRFGK